MCQHNKIIFNPFIILIIIGGSFQSLHAQKKVVVMGSSTALGAAATSGSLGWVGRMQTYYRQNMADGLDTTFTVVGQYGAVTYWQMPSTFISPYPPPIRPGYNPGFNVDQALSYNPDIVIINLPTNDMAAGYTKKEFMDNLRYLRSFILTNGIPGVQCYIATTQPRNDLTNERRDSLRTLVDSIVNNFGIYSINFWDDLVTNDGQNLLKDDVRHMGFPDAAYHLNDLGHYYLFIRATNKNIFAPGTVLPVKLKSFKAEKKNSSVVINWQTDQEETNTYYEIQRSNEGIYFQTLYKQQSNGIVQVSNYSWIDKQPLAGKSFYRLKITEPVRISFSEIIPITYNKNEINIIRLYRNSDNLSIVAEVTSFSNQNVDILVNNLNGTTVFRVSKYIGQQNEKITVPIETLANGQYFFTIITTDGIRKTRAFIK